MDDAARSARQLYRDTRRAALGGLIVTLSLGVAKLLGGLFGHSLALISDSVHSFGDAISSASILAALWWAELPPDEEHPYGHTRVESIAAYNVSLLLMLSALWIAWEAIHHWGDAAPAPHGYTLLIAFASIGVNEAIYRYSMKVADRTGSKSLKASAWDQRLDAFGSLVVFVGLAVAAWGGPDWQYVDKLAALGVAALILWAGGMVFWSSSQDLMDRQAAPDVLAIIVAMASTVAGVRGVDKLLVRKSGLEYFVDIHIQVAAEISVKEGHEIGHAVKNRLVSELAAVKDVLVHIEPHG